MVRSFLRVRVFVFFSFFFVALFVSACVPDGVDLFDDSGWTQAQVVPDAIDPGDRILADRDPGYDGVDLFDDSVINKFWVSVDPLQIELLNRQGPDQWVPDDHIDPHVDFLKFTDVVRDVTVEFTDVTASLAGQMSFQPIPLKAGWKFDLNDFNSGRTLGGYDDLRLRNMLYGGRLREWFIYQKVFPFYGQPAAQASHAWFSADYLTEGLQLDYLILEAVKDDALDRMFGKNNWVAAFEGIAGELPYGVECQDGDCASVDLAAWIAPFLDGGQALPRDGRIDWPDFWRFWALENALAQWDGYTAGMHNYFMAALPSENSSTGFRLELIPHGVDLCLGGLDHEDAVDGFIPPYGARASVATKCLADAWCRSGYVTMLRSMAETWPTEQFVADLRNRAAFLRAEGMWYPEDDGDLEYLVSLVEGRPRALAMAADMYEALPLGE